MPQHRNPAPLSSLQYITTFLHYNLHTDTFIERMPADPAPFLEMYYVPVRLCGSAVSLVFLPDKRALLCILSQSGKYDVWKYSSKYSQFLRGHRLIQFHLCIHYVHTHFLFHVQKIVDHSDVLLIIM